MKEATRRVIEKLEEMPKHGQSYDQKGRHGWRNPIRQDTGNLLRALVMARQPKRILEIGTAHGLSGCYLMADCCGELTTIEWDEQTAEEARQTFRRAGLNRVSVLCGDAMKVIPRLSGTFDLVFFDANKDGYNEQFLELLSNKLLSNDCLLIADNVIDRATECAAFLETMEAFEAVTINTECGLLVANIP